MADWLSNLRDASAIALPFAAVSGVLLGYYLQSRIQRQQFSAESGEARRYRRGSEYLDLYASLASFLGRVYVLSVVGREWAPHALPPTDPAHKVVDLPRMNQLANLGMEAMSACHVEDRTMMLDAIRRQDLQAGVLEFGRAVSAIRSSAYDSFEATGRAMLSTEMAGGQREVLEKSWRLYKRLRADLQPILGGFPAEEYEDRTNELIEIYRLMLEDTTAGIPPGQGPLTDRMKELLSEEVEQFRRSRIA